MGNLPTSPGAIAKGWRVFCSRGAALLLVVLICRAGSFAYSVLTHEEIVDLVWADEIRPLLLQRYPGLCEDQMKEAHAYAYGGAVIQDLGYYPFGSRDFSNLVHYVRSDDFVLDLLLESQDVNEYAFALGALSHYASDIAGHPAVNQAVAIEYPKLRAKYGKSVHRSFLEQERPDTLVLPNCDLDSGKPTKAAEYSLADDSYARLLAQLSKRKFDRTAPELRDNILQFYSDLSLQIETKKDQVRWQGVLTGLDQLKLITPVPVVARIAAQ